MENTETQKNKDTRKGTEIRGYTDDGMDGRNVPGVRIGTTATVLTSVKEKLLTDKEKLLREVECYLQEHPAKYGGMVDSMIEFIYMNYTEFNPVEDDRVKQLDAQLYKRFMALTGSVDAAEELMNLVSNICSEYERVSYMEGIRVGARLVMELVKE